MTAAIAEIKAIDNAQYCPNVSVSKIPKHPLAPLLAILLMLCEVLIKSYSKVSLSKSIVNAVSLGAAVLSLMISPSLSKSR